jgi:hypothetical protein
MPPLLLNTPPAGYHALDVMREYGRTRSRWVALMISVPPEELKYCRSEIAFLYVHPNEYRPRDRRAREAWVRIPGKHRTKDAAWEALQDMLETRH